jgi:hypothetical protein
MWQMNGSSSSLENRQAKRYIKRLNKDQYAGYSDWRMPTVEELASLIKKDIKNGVHIDPVFDNKQISCWTADSSDPKDWIWYLATWIVDFKDGTIHKATWEPPWKAKDSVSFNIKHINYVKAVRSLE